MSSFEKKIELLDKKGQKDSDDSDDVLGKPTRAELKDAAIFVNDTLELAWACAKNVFDEKVDPEIAVAIYDRIVDRLEMIGEDIELSE